MDRFNRRSATLIALFGLLIGVAFFTDNAYAARAAAGGLTAASFMKSAAVVGPLGINPFLALAGFGAAATFTGWTPPVGLAPLTHPVLWIGMLGLGLLLQFGRSTKFTKPIAEAFGTGESLIAIVATALMMYPHFTGEAAGMATADAVGGALMIVVGLTAVMVLIVMRTALDIMIWLSPFPFVDAVFQIIKAVLTVGLVAIAIAFPTVAVVINALLLIATALLIRWAVRTARFGVAVASDLTIGRFKPQVELPRDEVMKNDLGPFVAFSLEVEGISKRTRGTLELKADRWFFKAGDDERPLGDGNKSTLTQGFLGTELQTPGGAVLLPPRYKHLIPDLTQMTHAETGAQPSLLAERVRPRTQATTA